MYKLYKRDRIWFAVVWIIIYCVVSIPIRGNFGDESAIMLLALIAIATVITVFIKRNNLEEEYGLKSWTKNPRRYLYFIPVWFLVTGNLWGGVEILYPGVSQLYAVLSMLIIGYIEEVIFRGFLFKGMLATDSVRKSVIISAVTFGIGHIVNLFAGQANLETFIQVFFAIAWGFIFTAIFYKGKSLIPCIIAHGLVNSLAEFGCENITMEWVYMIATIIVAIIYCIYLFNLKDENSK